VTDCSKSLSIINLPYKVLGDFPTSPSTRHTNPLVAQPVFCPFQLTSLCFLRNMVKRVFLDKIKRTGHTRQTDTALTADRAYKQKNLKHEHPLRKSLGLMLVAVCLKRTREVNCTVDGNEFQTPTTLSTKKYLRAQRERYRPSLCA